MADTYPDLTKAVILADTISPSGDRLTTVQATFPRFILAEVNTHRQFCLAGDAKLEFDMPAGAENPNHRRAFKMTIAEFVDKWHNGAAPRPNKRRQDGTYGFNRQPMRERLQEMRIRQLDETTGLIRTSTVTDAFVSGLKRVYEVRAGKFKIAGSSDHRIYTPDGWRTIGELAPGDLIVIRRFGKRDEDLLDPVRLKKIGGEWRSVWQRKKRAELIDLYGGCTGCGSTDDLHVHHLVSVHVAPELAFADDNVTLLCGDCHTDEHRDQSSYMKGGTYLYGDAVVVDEVAFRGHEMTYDLAIDGKYPNFIANGVVVHNSRNSASSRAIPTKRQLELIEETPFVPQAFPINKPGMSATEYIWPGDEGYDECVQIWLSAAQHAVAMCRNLTDAFNVHKQIANRLVEPHMWHTAIISATWQPGDWPNFFDLRISEFAQPEIVTLAKAIKAATDESEPRPAGPRPGITSWHLPLIEDGDDRPLADLIKSSVARVAAVSYNRQDRKAIDAEALRYDDLAVKRHLSPFEHVAQWAPGRWGNFWGWKQVRWNLENRIPLDVVIAIEG